jgi:hypothetical protein
VVGPKPGRAAAERRAPEAFQGSPPPIFEGEELEETIRAAHEPYRTLFTVAALTGARVRRYAGSGGRTCAGPPRGRGDRVCVRGGPPRQTATGKTDGSVRTVPIPHGLAMLLVTHNLRARHSEPESRCSLQGRDGHSLSGMSPARCGRHRRGLSARAGGRRPSPSIRRASRREARCLPCTHSGALWRAGRCSPGRAWTSFFPARPQGRERDPSRLRPRDRRRPPPGNPTLSDGRGVWKPAGSPRLPRPNPQTPGSMRRTCLICKG